ncbi:MAG: HPr family phosphocarrier protein [Gallicola sp.]|nr:HPr family phosphocarrier protein [Gallicola sp.]
MVEEKVTITNSIGLHARPASQFLRTATQFESEITLIKDDREYNGKSIISILAMAAKKDTKLTIRCSGVDEVQALEKLTTLVKNELEI